MHRRTLALLATPAVVGAMTVAVPAIARTDAPATPMARQATTKAPRCVVAHISRKRVCLLRGPRGPRGPRGLSGPASTRGPQGVKGATGARGRTGATGKTGATGATGPTGPGGAAGASGPTPAYAVVQPTSETQANLIAGQTSNVTGVSEPSAGVYCLAPAAGFDPAKAPAVASAEVSYSSAGSPGVIAVNAQHPNCPSGFEVDTYGLDGKLASGYAFTVLIP